MAMIPMELADDIIDVHYQIPSGTTITANTSTTVNLSRVSADSNIDLTQYNLLGVTYCEARGSVKFSIRGYRADNSYKQIIIYNPTSSDVTINDNLESMICKYKKK